MITLQHVEPHYARGYLSEFARVLAPGGAMLFQLPAQIPQPQTRPNPFWPPTVAKRLLRAINRTTAKSPLMEMHAIPRAEVCAILTAAGAEIVDIIPHVTDVELESYSYLARKP